MGSSEETATTSPSHVYIILVSSNGWRHTIECLESVLRLDYPNYTVIVCDNNSSDGSLEQIRRWARGEISAETSNPELARLTSPPVPKPLQISEVTRDSAPEESEARLVLIPTGANLGFAGGCNVGLRYALRRGDCAFAWLLNNDTVVEPDALTHLVHRMLDRPDAGMCGSTLLYYDHPSKVQACGGSVYNKWFARGGNIGNFFDAARLPEVAEVEREMAYVSGASMLVRRSFLERIGLMNEQYFLTFEEIDWATRARGGFLLAYAASSFVYHKEGATMGSHRATSRRSPSSEFYCTRSRVLFTRKHYPAALFSVLCAIALSALYRSLHRQWKNCGAVLRGVFQGLMIPNTPREHQP